MAQAHGGWLYTINISTGAATFIGDTCGGSCGPGACGSGGIAFAPNGTLYQIAFSDCSVTAALNTISPVDAHRISSVNLPVNSSYDGLGVRPDGTLFADLAGTDQIYTIDPVTGARTFIGDTGTGSVSDIAFRLQGVCASLPRPRQHPRLPHRQRLLTRLHPLQQLLTRLRQLQRRRERRHRHRRQQPQLRRPPQQQRRRRR